MSARVARAAFDARTAFACVPRVARTLPRRRAAAHAINGDQKPGTSSTDANDSDDLIYVAKLFGVSTAVAVAIKYGSLLTPVATTADPTLALAMVLLPPVLYGTVKLAQR